MVSGGDDVTLPERLESHAISVELVLLPKFSREVFHLAPSVPITRDEGPQVAFEFGRIGFYSDSWDAPDPDLAATSGTEAAAGGWAFGRMQDPPRALTSSEGDSTIGGIMSPHTLRQRPVAGSSVRRPAAECDRRSWLSA